MLTVKQVAEQLEMSPHTVRFYCDSGLIPNLKRDKNNVRRFDDEAAAWLFVVKYLRECGMSLEAIKQYIELCLLGNVTPAAPKRQSVLPFPLPYAPVAYRAGHGFLRSCKR